MRILLFGLFNCRLLSARLTQCDVAATRTHGFELHIAKPQSLEKVTGPVEVRLNLTVTNGSLADVIRARFAEFEVCYGALGVSRCLSLQGDARSPRDLALDLPAWDARHQVVGWLERRACMMRVAKASVDVFVVDDRACTHEDTVRVLRPNRDAQIVGEYVDVEVAYDDAPDGTYCCYAVLDVRKCRRIKGTAGTLRGKVVLPEFARWRLFAWTEHRGCVGTPATVEFSTTSEQTYYRFGRYAHPRSTHPWLSFDANYSVAMDTDCGPLRSAACVLERRVSCGNACHYFQHAAPFLLACWSFFRAYSHLEPVLVLRDGLYLGDHRWTRGLLAAMRCTVVEHSLPRCAVIGRLEPGATSWDASTPGTSRDLGWTPLSWLASVADATALQERVLLLGASHSTSLTKVGVLNRATTGTLSDAGALVRRLQREFLASSLVEVDPAVAYFENASFEEQAAWMRTHDVIVAPHGAQMTNLVWLRPCAAVLELFPPFYFTPGYFLTLALNVGALAYFGYPGKAPELDIGRVLEREPYFMNNFRRAPIRLENLDILTRVTQAMIADRARCLDRLSMMTTMASTSDKAARSVHFDIMSPRPNACVGSQLEITVRVPTLPVADTNVFELGDIDPSQRWFVCYAALGDRSCVAIDAQTTTGFLDLPLWTGKHDVRVTAWLECERVGSWISPTTVDVAMFSQEQEGSDVMMTDIRLAILRPVPESSVQSPVGIGLRLTVGEPNQPNRDFRSFRICYAALDQRRCSLLWPHQRAVSSDEETMLKLEALPLPPGHHQVVAWIEADGTSSVVFDRVRCHVVPPSPLFTAHQPPKPVVP